MSAKPNIFQYEDYRLYFKALFTFKKSFDRQFSYRKFSSLAGFGSPSYLKMVVDGKRRVSTKNLPQIATAFGLDRLESKYLYNLVEFNHAATVERRDFFFEQIQKLRKTGGMKRLLGPDLEFISKWYYVPVRELVNLKDFTENPQWISNKLRPKISCEEASEAWQWLVNHKFVKKENDQWVLSDPLVTSGLYSDAYVVTLFHDQLIKRSLNAIWKIPGRERDISATTIAIKKKDLPDIVRQIIQLRRNILTKYDSDGGGGEQLYQLNIQLFPVSE